MEYSKDVLIAGPPANTAGVMFDPARETEWLTSVTSSVAQSVGIQPGAEVKRVSHLNGADVTWSTVVEQFHFPHVLVLRIDGSGHTGYIHYEVQRYAGGSIARVRAECEQDLFGFDLEKLKTLVEG